MVQLPNTINKAYGAACLLMSSLRTVPIVSQPDDFLRPSLHLKVRPVPNAGGVRTLVTFASWNVYEGRSKDDVLDGIESIMQDYGADALALQEVPRELLTHPRLAPYHIAFAPDNYEGVTRDKKTNWPTNYATSTGNAILSPHLMTDVAVVDLPIASWNYHGKTHVTRRNAIGVRIAKDVEAWSTHLDLHCPPRLRAYQLAPALDFINTRKRSITLLGMDANVIWQPVWRERAMDLWYAHGYRDPWGDERRPFPAYLDQVLCRGAQAALHAHRILDIPGSDHRALLATVKRK